MIRGLFRQTICYLPRQHPHQSDLIYQSNCTHSLALSAYMRTRRHQRKRNCHDVWKQPWSTKQQIRKNIKEKIYKNEKSQTFLFYFTSFFNTLFVFGVGLSNLPCIRSLWISILVGDALQNSSIVSTKSPLIPCIKLSKGNPCSATFWR